MADDVKISIGGEDSGFSAALEEAKVKAAEAAETIKASFESINETFEKVQSAFLAFTAILAGGEAFKEMIGSTVNATVSATALGKQLGISTTTASQLAVGLNATHVTTEQFAAANQKLTVTMNKNEGAIKALGVETRNADGSYRNSLDVQLDVNEALMKVKAGMDRNIEGTKIYGKGWMDAAGTLRMTRDAMGEATETANVLGLTIGQEQKDAVDKYRKAMVEVHDVIEALGKVIAAAVLPVLTGLGEWFAGVGPQAVGAMRIAVDYVGERLSVLWDTAKAVWNGLGEIFTAIGRAVASVFGPDAEPVSAMDFFKTLLKEVEAAFIGLSVGIEAAVEVIVALVDNMAGEFERLAATSGALFRALAGTGSWSEVSAAWTKGSEELQRRAQAHQDAIVRIAQAGHDKLAALLSDPMGQAPTVTDTKDGGDGGKHAKDTAEKMAALMGELAKELAAKKAAWDDEQHERGTFIQFSLAQEKQFWDDNLSRAAAGSVQRAEILKNSHKLQSEIDKAAYTAQLADIKERESQYKNNLQAKLALAVQYAAMVEKAEPGSAAAKKAEGEVLAIHREMRAAQLAIDESYAKSSDNLELARIDAAQREAELQTQLGKTTDAQLLAQEQSFEEARYQLKLQALQRSFAIYAQDPMENVAKLAATNQEILALQIQHDASMDKLRIKSVEDSNKEYKAMFATMQSGFQSTIAGFLKGTTSVSSAIKGMFTDVSNAVVESLSKVLAQQVINAITGNAISRSSSLAQKEDAAWVAAGNAWKSAAAIPYVGWVLGPIEAAAAYAGVMAFGSAEGGYDIPAGINPIMQTHGGEMILPTKHADVIRGLADNKAPSAAGSNMHFQIQALDGHSVQKVLTRNASHVAKALKKMDARFMKK